MKIAVVTSGGDAPGMNAAVRAVARIGFSRGWEVSRVDDGYRQRISQLLRRCAVATVSEEAPYIFGAYGS